MATSLVNAVVVVAAMCSLQTLALPVKRSTSRNSNVEVKRVVEGTKLELNCVARGSSPIVFHWLHKGDLINQSPLDLLSENIVAPALVEQDEDMMIRAEGQLVIPNVSQRHSGKYTCVADTGVERTTESFTVEVVPNKSETESVEDELRIYQFSTLVGVIEGSPAYFTCRATQGAGRDPPQIKWTLGGNIVENDVENGVQVHGNGDLQLSHITSDYHIMENNLVCVAYGDHGQVVRSSPVRVYVFEKED